MGPPIARHLGLLLGFLCEMRPGLNVYRNTIRETHKQPCLNQEMKRQICLLASGPVLEVETVENKHTDFKRNNEHLVDWSLFRHYFEAQKTYRQLVLLLKTNALFFLRE